MGDLTEVQASQAVKITDGSESDFASIGNFSTNANPAIRVLSESMIISHAKILPIVGSFLNAGSSNLNVNGSVTPVDFTVAPPSGQIWFIEYVSIVFIDPTTPSATEFGNITGLANGLRLQLTVDSVDYDIFNVQNNARLHQAFVEHSYSAGVGGGWLDEQDAFVGSLVFKNPVRLNGTNGDLIKFNIRDNLTAIDHFSASAKGFRIL